MTAIESSLADAGDRLGTAARRVPGLMALGGATTLLGVVYYAISMRYNLDDPNEGLWWDLEVWEWAMLSLPMVLPLTAAALLMTAAAKRLPGLREGRGRRSIRALSFWAATGSGLYAAFLYWMLALAEDGYSLRLHSLSALGEDLSGGSLNPVGWMGVAAVLGLVVLLAGALAITVLTRPQSAEQTK